MILTRKEVEYEVDKFGNIVEWLLTLRYPEIKASSFKILRLLQLKIVEAFLLSWFVLIVKKKIPNTDYFLKENEVNTLKNIVVI